MSFLSRLKSFIYRLDNLKINKSKGVEKAIYFTILKFVNFFRWIKAYKIIGRSSSLNDYYSELNIFWYGGNEGHTQQVEDETSFLKKRSSRKKNILEIGFNGGHSSETFLISNKDSFVESIDIGFHHYVRFGNYYLKKKYPERFKLHIGSSNKVLPQLIIKKNIYDLIFIDGSHDYLDVVGDLKDSNKLSNEKTLIILDDVYMPNENEEKSYFDGHNTGPTRAWKEFVSAEIIKHDGYIEFLTENTNKRSLSYGRYIKFV